MPPERDNVKSEASIAPLPVFVLWMGSEKVTDILALFDETVVREITGAVLSIVNVILSVPV